MTTDDMLKKASSEELQISEAMKTFLKTVWETDDFRLAAKKVGWSVAKAPQFFEQGMDSLRKKHGLPKNASKTSAQWIKLIEKV